MELRIGGHKTVHADYVSYICQILVLYNVGPYAWDSRRLRILNESMSMCDLLLPTGFKGSNVITNQRCDNVLGFMMRVLGNWLWRIYHYYSTRTWILIKHPFYLLYFTSIYVVNIASYFCFYCSWHELSCRILCIAILPFCSNSCRLSTLNKV